MGSGKYGVDSKYAWVVAFAAFVCYSVSIGCYVGTTGIFFSVFLEEFQLNLCASAVMSTLTNIVYLGCGVVAGYMTNQLGCRLVVLLGSTSMGLAFVLSSFSQSMTLIYFTQGLLKGLGTILLLQPLFVIVANYHVKRLALAMSIVASGAGAGAAIFSPLSQYLINSYGWRRACRILGYIFFGLGSLAAMTFSPIKLRLSVMLRRVEPLSLRQLFKIPAFRYFSLSIFFYGAYLTAYTTFLTDFAESRNISPSKTAALWTYWGIATAAGRLFGGLLKSTRFGRIRDFTLAVMGMGVFSWILAFSSEDYPNYNAFVISQICNGWLMGMLYHLASLCVGDVFGVENVSLGMGLFFTVQMPAGVAGPPLIGWVADQAGGNYTLSFQIMAVVQTLSGVLMFFFWKYGHKMMLDRSLSGNETRTSSMYENSGFFGTDNLERWHTRKLTTLREFGELVEPTFSVNSVQSKTFDKNKA